MNVVKNLICLVFLASLSTTCRAESKHSDTALFTSYRGLVMCGYQGWFRAEGDGSHSGWSHFGRHRQFDPEHVTIDLWPDVSEYEKTYSTDFKLKDGQPAHVFSSWDKSTVDLHFRWMKEYGIDGVFMQRFYGVTRSPRSRARGRVILDHAVKAANKHGRAVAVMYDLSGLRPGQDDCSSVIEDWKELVDELRLTSQGEKQSYLYHRGKPLVAIWGIGFPDRPYDIQKIGLQRLIDFLKNDPEYGGCSIMLGVPTYFRTLDRDCVSDPYLHKIIEQADIVMPWMVQRFTSLLHREMRRYAEHVKADIDWCKKRNVDYVPLVYPGFSWYNLSQVEFDGRFPLNQNPREGGRFYWGLISSAIDAGAEMLYVAMYDEVDEGTAIFKCTNEPPVDVPAITYEGLPSDHYLWLTGQAAKTLKGEVALSKKLPVRPARNIEKKRTAAESEN